MRPSFVRTGKLRAGRGPRLAALLLGLFAVLPCLAGETRLAVAANFYAPMQAIASAFEKETGHSVSVSYGSSGKLYAQVRNGAPFDVFLSADAAKPDALVADGDAVADSRFVYALGTLALWGPGTGDSLNALRRSHYQRLAVADPRLAPYGLATMEVLDKLKLVRAAKEKLVTGESIAQAYQFVASGNAQLGFVALSQLDGEQRDSGDTWVVPDDMHQPIRQVAVLLEHGRDNPASTALLAYLKTDATRALIRSYGYGTGD